MTKLFIPFSKIDEASRTVYGLATFEGVDSSDEIWDYESSKPYFEEWSANAEKTSGGKSLGNLRSMHTNIAAGKLTQLVLDDETKSCQIAAKVVDDAEWEKVLEGVYTGFSQGGKYIKRWKDSVDKTKTRFTSQPTEISLVDLPCLPGATFEVIKADGTTLIKMHKERIGMPTNEEIAARATEMAKAAGNEAAWPEHIEAARAELVAKATAAQPTETPPAPAPAPAAEQQPAETQQPTEQPTETTTEQPAPVETQQPTEQPAPDADAARAEAAKSVTQGWTTPDGTFFEKKADAVAHVLAKSGEALSPVQAALAKAREAAAGAIVVAKSERDVPAEMGVLAKQLVGVAEAHPALAKGLYTLSSLADQMCSFNWLTSSVVSEEAREGDTDSELPEKARAVLAAMGDLVISMAQEEVAEVLAQADGNTPAYLYNAQAIVDLVKGNADLMAKAGARNSKADMEKIQAVHDHSASLGAKCDKGNCAGDDADKAAGGDLAKRLEAENADLKKQVGEAVEGIGELTKTIGGLKQEIEKLRHQPAPMAPRAAPVEKGGAPAGGGAADPSNPASIVAELMKSDAGRNALVDAAIRASQRNGVQPT